MDPLTGSEVIQGGVALGGLLGGGSSSSKPPYQYGETQSSSFDTSGSSSHGSSQQFADQVWGAQAPFFQNLWGAGAGLLSQPGGDWGYQGANQIYQQVGQGLQQHINPGQNPMIGAYASDLANQFNQQIMPALGSQAVAAGQLGGTRQGVAEGLAAGEMQRNLQNFTSQQYQADMNRSMQGLQQLQGLGQWGMGIPWYGLQQMAGLLGSPTVLGQGGVSSNAAGSHALGTSQSSGFDISGPNQGFVDPYLPNYDPNAAPAPYTSPGDPGQGNR